MSELGFAPIASDSSLRDPGETPTSIAQDRAEQFRMIVSPMLALGAVLNALCVIIGREKVLRYILTPAVDMTFSVPMTVASYLGWKLWKQPPAGESEAARRVRQITTVYFTASLPLHYQTWVTKDFGKVLHRLPKRVHPFIVAWQTWLAVKNWKLAAQSENDAFGTALARQAV